MTEYIHTTSPAGRLLEKWTALECFSTLPPSPWKLQKLQCKNSASVKAACVQPDTKQNVAYHVQPHSFIPLGSNTSSCAHCSQLGAGKDKCRYGAPASSETESNSSNAHIESLLRHMCFAGSCCMQMFPHWFVYKCQMINKPKRVLEVVNA